MSAGIAIDKSELLTWVATLAADDPRLALLDKIRRGEASGPEESLLSLKELGETVRTDPSWLSRLEIQKHCGHKQAGSFRYRLSEVREFLASAACGRRIAELREEREQRRRREKEPV